MLEPTHCEVSPFSQGRPLDDLRSENTDLSVPRGEAVRLADVRVQERPGAPVTILSRLRWPSGVVTETMSRVEATRAPDLFSAL